MKSEGRQSLRAPVALQVHYRTQGSFLVSYSMNLSKGGVFLETEQVLPIGTDVRVQFSVPNVQDVIDVNAKVVWVRPLGNSDGLPAGLGLQFLELDATIGSVIDRWAQEFSGMRLMICAGPGAGSDRLQRYLTSILNCEVLTSVSLQAVEQGLRSHPDLIVMDLDSVGGEAPGVLKLCQEQNPPIPMIGLVRNSDSGRTWLQQGLRSVLKNPPVYEELRQQVLDLLGRPWRTT